MKIMSKNIFSTKEKFLFNVKSIEREKDMEWTMPLKTKPKGVNLMIKKLSNTQPRKEMY